MTDAMLPLDLPAPPVGDNEAAVTLTLEAAAAGGRLAGDVFALARAALLSLARALDAEDRRLALYSVPASGAASLHRELRETLTSYGLTPGRDLEGGSGDASAGDLADVLRLGVAARGDAGAGGGHDDDRPGPRSTGDGRSSADAVADGRR
jgi:hypothetical protein